MGKHPGAHRAEKRRKELKRQEKQQAKRQRRDAKRPDAPDTPEGAAENPELAPGETPEGVEKETGAGEP